VKKVLVAFLLVSIMAFSFAVPVAASDVVVAEVVCVSATPENITPFSEITRNYFRWSICGCGGLQMRVWGITSGRWLTEWTYL